MESRANNFKIESLENELKVIRKELSLAKVLPTFAPSFPVPNTSVFLPSLIPSLEAVLSVTDCMKKCPQVDNARGPEPASVSADE